MTTVEMTFSLSAPARRALVALASPRRLDFISERFYDKLRYERYRDFAITPRYATSAQGLRKAESTSQRQREENLAAVSVAMSIPTLQRMKKLHTRGLNFTWQMEEMLLFAFKHDLFESVDARTLSFRI